MNLDDDVCVCHHVSLRKLESFARRTRPLHASQMAECLGAGTGCGWCIPFLARIAAAAQRDEAAEIELTAEQYAAARRDYHRDQARARAEKTPPEPRP